MNAKSLAEYAFNDPTIRLDHIAMLRSVYKSNAKKGKADKARLIVGLAPAVEQACRMHVSNHGIPFHWSVVFRADVRNQAAILLADMVIASLEAAS